YRSLSLPCCLHSTLLSLILILPPPPTPTLFPYTTLFRSASASGALRPRPLDTWARAGTSSHLTSTPAPWLQKTESAGFSVSASRSEEHTSELQSRFDLVCRLLLEKKKSVTYIHIDNTIHK